jgi:hypothetical protein
MSWSEPYSSVWYKQSLSRSRFNHLQTYTDRYRQIQTDTCTSNTCTYKHISNTCTYKHIIYACICMYYCISARFSATCADACICMYFGCICLYMYVCMIEYISIYKQIQTVIFPHVLCYICIYFVYICLYSFIYA